jgi:hypothetical protein
VTHTIASTFQQLFLQFAPAFSAPSLQNFMTLATGWILCTGRHTISRVIQHGLGDARRKHHSTLYRFFSRAAWIPDALGEVLLKLILPLIPGRDVYVLADDTLCRKSGPHLWGAAMHHDPLASTYGRGTKVGRKVSFAFGHNWVIVSLWVPLPWNGSRGLALPILLRLYRSKKRCPETKYRKRTELAAEMIRILISWMPSSRRMIVVADSEYACETLVKSLPEEVVFIGPMVMDAAFYAFPEAQQGRGRRRKKGKRLPSPEKLAQDSSIPWKHCTLSIYGRTVKAWIKTQTGLWYKVAGIRPVRMIVTRDPRGRIEDRAYVCTDPEFCVEAIAQGFSRRWAAEVMHRDAKQFLGLEDPQNGWWRRPQGTRARKKRPGPQAHATTGEKAVRHTAPLALVAYALVCLWYFKHGSAQEDVRRARKKAPWYLHKKEPSFADMLSAARRELWTARFSSHPALRAVSAKIRKALPEWLLAA